MSVINEPPSLRNTNLSTTGNVARSGKVVKKGIISQTNMKLDIHAAVQTAFYLTLLAVLLSIWAGIRIIQSGQQSTYFRVGRQRIMFGWRMMVVALLLLGLALFLGVYAEPIIYDYFPPTPTQTVTLTLTSTASVTSTASATVSPTISLTPNTTYTPTLSPTPFLPLVVELMFQSSVTPNPEAVISGIEFSRRMSNAQAVNPGTVFQNPVGHMYGVFTYDQMTPGVQWTALWFRGDLLVFYETKPWDGAVGGYGFTDWNPTAEEWLPGNYNVQIFVGMEWKVAGTFTVEGEPVTSTPGSTPVQEVTPTP